MKFLTLAPDTFTLSVVICFCRMSWPSTVWLGAAGRAGRGARGAGARGIVSRGEKEARGGGGAKARPEGHCRAVSPPIHSVPCLVVAEEVGEVEEAVEAGKVEGVGGGWQSSCVGRRMTIFGEPWRRQCWTIRLPPHQPLGQETDRERTGARTAGAAVAVEMQRRRVRRMRQARRVVVPWGRRRTLSSRQRWRHR